MRKLRKAHCSPPLVDEDNSMVFTAHSVPFPARSLVAGNGTSWRQKPFNFLHTSDGKQILINCPNQPLEVSNELYHNFVMVSSTAVKLWKLRKAHCSLLVGFLLHTRFPATCDLWSLLAGNGTSWGTKTISFSSNQWPLTSDSKQILNS